MTWQLLWGGPRSGPGPACEWQKYGIDVATQGNKVFFTADGCRLPLIQKNIWHSPSGAAMLARTQHGHCKTALVPLGTRYNAP